ncbi:MAG TPA: hypothetical protein VM221_11290 [Armatimonadota bacterium]|nr:hypothetical protein [Armatimonadota bacterium]
MTPDVLKAAAYAAWVAVLTLAHMRLRRVRGGEIGWHDRIPGWYIAVVVVATIALAFAVGAANLFGRK